METFVSTQVMDSNFPQNQVFNAVETNNSERLSELIQAGHSVNSEGIDLIRPLHEACFRGHSECVRVLLDHGAEVSNR